MKKIKVITLISLLLLNYSFGQDRDKYSELIRAAWSLYEGKEYLKSGEKYTEAFEALGGKGVITDRYNAACAWALANKPDSAFVQLFKIAENGSYTNLTHLATDADLTSLHNDERWPKIIALVQANKEKAEADLDKPLVALLDTIFHEDQKYRKQLTSIGEKYGWESGEMKALWNRINEKDSINILKVKKILDERGWLGADVVGIQGATTLFLVIQHADVETQEKYLPMLREAVRNGNASASSLALLEDRVALRSGRKQIYGSQIGRDQATGEHYVLPLIDPENVDKRRSEVGLGTIQEYITNWGLTWDLEDYKMRLMENEANRE